MTLKVDASPFHNFPIDVLPNMFQYIGTELDKIALVCKTWQDVADSQTMRDLIRPLETMGVQELKKAYPNIIDAGEEHLLPRRAYRDFAEKKGWLFFNPTEVTIKCEDGSTQRIALNSLEIRGELFKDPLNPKPALGDHSFNQILKEKRKEKSSYWAWIDTNIVGFGKSFNEQLGLIKEEDRIAYPERYKDVQEDTVKQIIHLATANDLVQGTLLAHAILKNNCLSTSPDQKLVCVRVKDKFVNDGKISVISMRFPSSQIEVYFSCSIAMKLHGIVCVRKFYNLNN